MDWKGPPRSAHTSWVQKRARSRPQKMRYGKYNGWDKVEKDIVSESNRLVVS